MYLQRSEPHLGATGLGLCAIPKGVTVRNLIATDADLAAIGAQMGKGRDLVIREVRTTIEDTVRRALVLIERAESQLKFPRATLQAGDAMRRRFREAFGTTPEFVPTWRPAGATWDMGAVVRERLRCAAKKMSDGSIEWVAWGPGSCPYRWDWAARPAWAVVVGNRSRICLGQPFWGAAGRADNSEMAVTLLHECLHIYFDTMHRHDQERWAFNTPTCYERYVLICNGIPIPPAVTCPSKLAGFGELAQPSDEERSKEFLKKVLEINPRDGYVAGSSARRKLHLAVLTVPLPSAKALHDQLKNGTGALGQLFQGRLHSATRKWVLGMLWNKHLAHSKLSQ